MSKSETTNIKSARPALLSALCILTFIGSTLGFTGYFLASVFYEKFSEIITTYSSWSNTDNISPMYFTLLMVFYAVSLIGAIRMWKLHRNGFFLYLIAQLAVMFIPAIWINWYAFSFTNAIFSIVFFIGYAYNLRYMKR